MKVNRNSEKKNASAKIRLVDGVAFRVIEDEAVVVKPIDGSMMILNETGTSIIKSIGKGITEERLIKKIVDDYDIPVEVANRDVKSFLKRLKKEGIIEIS